MISKSKSFYKIVLLNAFGILFVVAALSANTAAQKKKADDKVYISMPVKFERLKTALEKKLLTNKQVVDTIESFGVDFALNKDNEAELKKAGATPAIISAIKENRRTDSEDKGVSAGVVNGKAVNLVAPPYPPAARAVRASGAVNVQVLITKAGDVYSATAVSGHPLLRAAAEQAARASKFEPTMLGGKPQAVKGIIVYNFVAQ